MCARLYGVAGTGWRARVAGIGYGRASHVDADVSCAFLAYRAVPAQVLKEVCMRGDFIHAEALK